MKTWQGNRQHTGASPFRRLVQSTLAAAAIVIAGPASSGQQPSNDAMILVDATPGVVSFFVNSTEAPDGMLTVRIADAMGETVFEMSSTAGYVDWMPADLPAEGTYNFDAWYSPASAGDAPDSAVESGPGPGSTKGHVATEALYHSGTLSVEFGEIEAHPVSGSATQDHELSSINQTPSLLENVAGAVLEFLIPAAKAEQVFTENVRIQKSAPQLFIEDTTSGGSDWDIGSNALLGGWHLRDQGTNNFIFRVQAGAPANSIIVEGTGDIGLGTSTPDLKLHIADTLPGIRFEDTNDDNHLWQTYITGKDYVIRDQTNFTSPVRIQDAAPTSSLHIDAFGRVGLGTSTQSEKLTIQGNSFGPSVGFRTNTGTKTWSLGATTGLMSFRDEANSRIPFAVASGAPADSFRVDSDGDIGLGTSSPTKQFHLEGNDSSGGANNNSQVKVTNVSGTTARRDMLTLQNNGEPKFVLSNVNNGETWDFSARTDGFNINLLGTGGPELRVAQTGFFQVSSFGTPTFTVGSTGKVFMTNDVLVEGTVVHSSSRETKKGITPVDYQVVLDKLDKVQVDEWTYKKDIKGNRHLSPMAEDFHAAFGLGPDNKHVAPSDLAGVALAAAKALKEENKLLKLDNAEMRARIARIEARLDGRAK